MFYVVIIMTTEFIVKPANSTFVQAIRKDR